MKVQKINSVSQTDKKTVFKSAKIKSSVLKTARRTLSQDSIELRKNLPNNKNAKSNKLYGYDPTGNNVHDEDITVGDAVGLGAMFALGLAASLL